MSLALLAGCAPERAAGTVTPTVAAQPSSACSPPIQTAGCGVSFEELKRINEHYADRLPFRGDPARALVDEKRLRRALAPLAGRAVASQSDIRTALVDAGFADQSVLTSTNAVRTAGTAFAVSVDGGCIFGAFYASSMTEAIGGYVNDGGCLAENGH